MTRKAERDSAGPTGRLDSEAGPGPPPSPTPSPKLRLPGSDSAASQLEHFPTVTRAGHCGPLGMCSTCDARTTAAHATVPEIYVMGGSPQAEAAGRSWQSAAAASESESERMRSLRVTRHDSVTLSPGIHRHLSCKSLTRPRSQAAATVGIIKFLTRHVTVAVTQTRPRPRLH